MKRILTFISLALCLNLGAQTVDDVLRYGTENLQGTARYQAMSGAFGALGGDLSALNTNPAGSAVFNNSFFSVTGGVYGNDNQAAFGGSFVSNQASNVELNQVGGVFVFKTTSDSPWKKLALAINYDMSQNFDNEIFVSGNTSQGLDQYFLNFAQGVPLGPLRVQNGEFIDEAYLDIGANLGFVDQQAFLGFQSGIIDPVADEDSNTDYFSNASYSTVNQDHSISTFGYNSKFTLNFAGQYQENFYLGASLNFHSVLYERITLIDESGYDTGSAITSAFFDNYLFTDGSGFSASVGAIAKLNEVIRIGGSYQTPTWYRLTDDLSQRVSSDFEFRNPNINQIDFNDVNLFEAYTIKTPAKVTGSLALVFGKEGLLSFDYGYQDFSNAQLRPTSDPNFSSENDFIAENLQAVSSYRIGGEYRFGNVSLRGGYRLEESPLASSNGFEVAQEGYSFGLGYSWGPNRIDLGYSHLEANEDIRTFDSSLAFINNTRVMDNISLTYSLNF